MLSGNDHGAGCGHVCGTLQSREAFGSGVLQCLGIYMPSNWGKMAFCFSVKTKLMGKCCIYASLDRNRSSAKFSLPIKTLEHCF